MIATVQKWGNSLGVRIPKPLAEDAALREGVCVEMRVRNGKLVLAPRKSRRYRLASLLRGMTADNLHREQETGEPVGREAW